MALSILKRRSYAFAFSSPFHAIIIIHLFRKKIVTSLVILRLINERCEKRNCQRIIAPIVRKFQRIQLQTHYKDECWSIDLTDCSSLSKYNKNFKFKFTIIDHHIKYAWAIPLKDKSGKSTTTAFKKLIKTSKRKPQKV